MRRSDFALAVVPFLASVLVAAVIALSGWRSPDTAFIPHRLTPEQRKWNELYQKVPPMTFTVHVLSHAEWKARIKSRNVPKTTAGWTFWPGPDHDGVCEIFIEEGFSIAVNPHDNTSGRFVETQMYYTFPHEILHCIDGDWHGG